MRARARRTGASSAQLGLLSSLIGAFDASVGAPRTGAYQRNGSGGQAGPLRPALNKKASDYEDTPRICRNSHFQKLEATQPPDWIQEIDLLKAWFYDSEVPKASKKHALACIASTRDLLIAQYYSLSEKVHVLEKWWQRLLGTSEDCNYR